MSFSAKRWGIISGLFFSSPAFAQTSMFQTKMYGFIDSYWEQVFNEPSIDENGNTVTETPPSEFDILAASLMIQGTLDGKYRYFMNTRASGGSPMEDSSIVVRNAWVETPLFSDSIQLRLGKTYRRFGLYNEILDATPTFIGIEAPELFDQDHLFLTRTTNAMVHGNHNLGDSSTLMWAVMTGNDERASNEIPIGADVRLVWDSRLTVGSSFYTTSGDAKPSKAVGEGSPRGGVADWMETDDYMVTGGFVEWKDARFTIQSEYWMASHEGVRDPASVMMLLDGDLNATQMANFFSDPNNPSEDTVITDATYKAQTAYVRAAYHHYDAKGREFTPYVQYDWYSNPELVQSKTLGGDNEAGLSDDGVFSKPTLGLIYRPLPFIATKVDGSAHIQQFNGEQVIYPELRFSMSYFWQQ